MNGYELIRSGQVRRWHMNPDMAGADENDAQHQWMVMQIVLILEPDASRDLIIEAAQHDVGELKSGDLSAPFKNENPAFAREHAWFEAKCRAEICGTRELTAKELEVLKLADRIAAFIWMLMSNPFLASRPHWKRDLSRIRDMALYSGHDSQVDKLIWEFAESGLP